MFAKKINVKGVPVEIVSWANSNVPEEVIRKVESFLEGRADLQIVADCFNYIQKLTNLNEKAKKGTVDFCQYFAEFAQLANYRRVKIDEWGLSTYKELQESFDDEYGTPFKLTLKIGVEDMEVPQPLTYTEAYRKLGFNSEFSTEILKHIIAIEKQRTGPPPEYNTPQELLTHLKSLDSLPELNKAKEMINEVLKVIQHYSFETEFMQGAVKNFLTNGLRDFEREIEAAVKDIDESDLVEKGGFLILKKETTTVEKDLRLVNYLHKIAELAARHRGVF